MYIKTENRSSWKKTVVAALTGIACVAVGSAVYESYKTQDQTGLLIENYEDPEIRASDYVGRSGSTKFQSEIRDGQMTMIHLRSGLLIDSVGSTVDGKKRTYGGNGGHADNIDTSKVCIDSVDVWGGDSIDSLRFSGHYLDSGKDYQSKKYGGNGGSKKTVDLEGCLVGFNGEYNGSLAKIGFVSRVQSPQNYEIVESKTVGRAGHSSFRTDLGDGQMTKIHIRTGLLVDSIGCTVDGKKQTFGGNGGSGSVIDTSNVCINSVDVWTGQNIDAFVFRGHYLDSGKAYQSKKYGGGGGSKKTVDLEGCLNGFKGDVGAHRSLSNIGFMSRVEVPDYEIVESEQVGRAGHSSFESDSTDGQMTMIHLRTGLLVDSIGITVDGKKQTFGGNGGSGNVIDTSNVCINSVDVWTGQNIDAFVFRGHYLDSDKAYESKKYGGGGGSKKTLNLKGCLNGVKGDIGAHGCLSKIGFKSRVEIEEEAAPVYEFVESQSTGRAGNKEFRSEPVDGQMTMIHLRTGLLVDSVGSTVNGKKQTFGGNGGHADNIDTSNVCIDSVDVWGGDSIDSLRFSGHYLDSGKDYQSKKYGGNGGRKRTIDLVGCLNGFKGDFKGSLSRIGFISRVEKKN